MQKYLFFFIICISCLHFFSGCGLDEYYIIEAPSSTYNKPAYNTADYAYKYFEFSTYENTDQMKSYLESSSPFKFLGTAVYYKIYNNRETMESTISSINSASSSTNTSAAASKLIEEYRYKQLGLTSGTITPLVKADGNNKKVFIRLSNYQENIPPSKFKAIVKINDKEISIPRRNGNKLSFDFGRSVYNENNAVPYEADEDVKYSKEFSDDNKKIWYVDMFAVAVGRDQTYTAYYSNVLHLGSVAIDIGSEDN